jgi:transcriptional regulator with XRE-family HTH domain
MSDQTSTNLSFSAASLARKLKAAREASGKSTTECGKLLGISSSRIRSYENGRYVPSLPELESLAYIYNIPLPALLNPDELNQFIHEPDTEQLKQLMDIRLHIIATRIQLVHENAGLSFRELSKQTGISTTRLKKYESGTQPIPLDDLTVLAQALDLDFKQLLDTDSPIGGWQTTQVKMQSFSELPEDTQSFILDPANQPYIALVKRLKAVGQDKFEQLTQSLQVLLDTFKQ